MFGRAETLTDALEVANLLYSNYEMHFAKLLAISRHYLGRQTPSDHVATVTKMVTNDLVWRRNYVFTGVLDLGHVAPKRSRVGHHVGS